MLSEKEKKQIGLNFLNDYEGLFNDEQAVAALSLIDETIKAVKSKIFEAELEAAAKLSRKRLNQR